MNAIICQAIRERRLLEFRHREHVRTFAPHVYGTNASGDELLSGYQVWGGSDEGESAGWKSFKVGEIDSLRLTRKKFGPRPEYQFGDPNMAQILCQI
jgi:hypothetical protein